MPEVADAPGLLAHSAAIVGAMDASKNMFGVLSANGFGYVKGIMNVSSKESRELGRRHYSAMGYGDWDSFISQLVAALREAVQNSLDASATKVTVLVKTVAKDAHLLLVLDNAPPDRCLCQSKFESVQTIQFASEKAAGSAGGKGCGSTLLRSFDGYFCAGAGGFKGSIGAQFVVSVSEDQASLFTLDAVNESTDAAVVASRAAVLEALQAAPSVAGSGGLVAVRFAYKRALGPLLAAMAYWAAQSASNIELLCDSAAVPTFKYEPTVLNAHGFRHELPQGRAVLVSMQVIRADPESPVEACTDSSGIQVWVSNLGIPMFVTVVWPNRMANTARLELLVSLRVESPADDFKDCDIFDTQRTNLRADAMGGLDLSRIVDVAVRRFETLLDKPTHRVVEGKISGSGKFDSLLGGSSRAMRKVAELLGLTELSAQKTAKEDPARNAVAKALDAALVAAIDASADPAALRKMVAALQGSAGNATANELVRVGVLALRAVEGVLRAEGRSSDADAAKAAAAEMAATRAAEMRITTERDGSDATAVRERVETSLSGLVSMPRHDETGRDQLPTYRHCTIVQLAEAIGRLAAGRMGLDSPPEFGVLFKANNVGLVTTGMFSHSRNSIFINADHFVDMFDSCADFSAARIVLSELRETTLHELSHFYIRAGPDTHDRQFWDTMSRMSNDLDVCDSLSELFVALGCTGRRARRSGGAYMLNLVTRVFNPKFKHGCKAVSAPRKQARAPEPAEGGEEKEEGESEGPRVPSKAMFDDSREEKATSLKRGPGGADGESPAAQKARVCI